MIDSYTLSIDSDFTTLYKFRIENKYVNLYRLSDCMGTINLHRVNIGDIYIRSKTGLIDYIRFGYKYTDIRIVLCQSQFITRLYTKKKIIKDVLYKQKKWNFIKGDK